ncbi:MAG: helix-turn-helix domain-containing protein [bacterium]
METIGQTFKAARERKRVSLSQAAARTRIKVQIIEGMERDDFSPIPAPAYAKGFIRMYAELLGLDPVPLVSAYVAEHQGKPRPKAGRVIPAPAPEPVKEAAKEPDAAPATESKTGGIFPGGMTWQRPALLVGSVLVVIAIAAGLSRCPSGDEGKPAKAARPAPAPKRNPLALIQEPREPYIHVAGVSTNQP